MQVFKYMKDHGLPDESCLTYNATDSTKFGGKKCPGTASCLNCMPVPTPLKDFTPEVCWPVEKPVLYKVLSSLRTDT